MAWEAFRTSFPCWICGALLATTARDESRRWTTPSPLAAALTAMRYAWRGMGDGWGVASLTLIPTLCCHYSMEKKKKSKRSAASGPRDVSPPGIPPPPPPPPNPCTE